MEQQVKFRIEIVQEPRDMQKAFEIRKRVFVDGQSVPLDREIDGLDDRAQHYLIYFENIPVGTARIRKLNKNIRIERLCILPEFHGKALGKILMARIIKDSLKQDPIEIYLHAQYHLVGYYEGLGFTKRGDVFMDAGIKHIEMFMKG